MRSDLMKWVSQCELDRVCFAYIGWLSDSSRMWSKALLPKNSGVKHLSHLFSTSTFLFFFFFSCVSSNLRSSLTRSLSRFYSPALGDADQELFFLLTLSFFLSPPLCFIECWISSSVALPCVFHISLTLILYVTIPSHPFIFPRAIFGTAHG